MTKNARRTQTLTININNVNEQQLLLWTWYFVNIRHMSMVDDCIHSLSDSLP